jgi:ketosteroid isomerase-like protein
MMRRCASSLPSLLCLLCLAGPLWAQAPADSAEAASGIAQSASAFSRALERGDAAGMADQYVGDATLIPPNGRMITGRDAILAFWTPRNPDFRTLAHSLTTDRLEVVGDVAVEIGTWRQEGQLRDEAARQSAGRYLVVWRRQPDGMWKMQFDSWTAPFPED